MEKMEKKIDKLEEAMTNLLTSQSNLLTSQAALESQSIIQAERYNKLQEEWYKYKQQSDESLKEYKRQSYEYTQRSEKQFQMIFDILNEHSEMLKKLPDAINVLNEHSEILKKLPDAIKSKIGFTVMG